MGHVDRVEKQKQEWQRGFVRAWVCACTGGNTANTAKRNQRAEAQRPRREQGSYILQTQEKEKGGERGHSVESGNRAILLKQSTKRMIRGQKGWKEARGEKMVE